MRVTLPGPHGSATRCALLTLEEGWQEATDRPVQSPGAQGWRGATAPLALLPTGRRGELALKLRPLLRQLPVSPRHAVAMARDWEREEARGQRGLSGDVVSHLWRERAWSVCLRCRRGPVTRGHQALNCLATPGSLTGYRNTKATLWACQK